MVKQFVRTGLGTCKGCGGVGGCWVGCEERFKSGSDEVFTSRMYSLESLKVQDAIDMLFQVSDIGEPLPCAGPESESVLETSSSREALVDQVLAEWRAEILSPYARDEYSREKAEALVDDGGRYFDRMQRHVRAVTEGWRTPNDWLVVKRSIT